MTAHVPVTVVAGEGALADFRAGLTGPLALDLLDQGGGRLLVQLPVGVGKSEWMVRTIEHVLTADTRYDLVVVLVPTWDVLRELKTRLPSHLRRVVLRPRPRRRCGDLDLRWLEYEQWGCGLLGREELCRHCPARRGCRWPRQFGQRLRRARLILATQAHLAINPHFVTRLCQISRARYPLVLLDESDFLLRSAERVIRAEDLDRFIEAGASLPEEEGGETAYSTRWRDQARRLREASTQELREEDSVDASAVVQRFKLQGIVGKDVRT